MSGKGAHVRVFPFLLGGVKHYGDFLSGKYHRGGRENLWRIRNKVTRRAFRPQGDGSFDDFHPCSRTDQNKVVHHLVDVVEKQFHLFAGMNV